MDRKNYIGSSDARHIMEGDLLHVWKLKTGRLPEPEETWPMFLGKHLEDLHLHGLEKLPYLKAAQRIAEEGWSFDPKGKQFETGFPFVGTRMHILSHHDHIVIRGDEWAPVEVKFTGRWENLEQAINYYMPQIQHQLVTSRASICLFSVMIGTEQPQIEWVGRGEEWIKEYKQRVTHLVECIEKDTPPDARSQNLVASSELLDEVPLNERKAEDMSSNNLWISTAQDYIRNHEASKLFEKAKKAFKDKIITNKHREVYGTVIVDDVKYRMTTKQSDTNRVSHKYEAD